ncbi:hypothetical protein K3495_g12754 [Podosphaera aphanis]|nr:hypothetical protein K3495_g12754 [Podosphaera aphanis]
MDNNLYLIGMIYKRRIGYSRCRLTVKDKIASEFVGRALQQEPTTVVPQSLDVFDCRGYFIRSDQILVAVDDALERITEKLKISGYRGYPVFYKTSGDKGSTDLYLWPLRINEQGLFYRVIFDKAENMFAVIDDFSNVYNVIMRVGEHELVDCERKTVDRILYESGLLYFSSRPKGYTTSISNAISKQSDLQRALAAGEIGVKGSTRPHKKQKLTIQ